MTVTGEDGAFHGCFDVPPAPPAVHGCDLTCGRACSSCFSSLCDLLCVLSLCSPPPSLRSLLWMHAAVGFPRSAQASASSMSNDPAAASRQEEEEEDEDSDEEYAAPPPRKMMTMEAPPAEGSEESAAAAAAGKSMGATKPYLGALVAPSAGLVNDPSPPNAGLALEWAYGYRAFDSKSNLCTNTRGEVIYPVSKPTTARLEHGIEERAGFEAQEEQRECMPAEEAIATHFVFFHPHFACDVVLPGRRSRGRVQSRLAQATSFPRTHGRCALLGEQPRRQGLDGVRPERHDRRRPQHGAARVRLELAGFHTVLHAEAA